MAFHWADVSVTGPVDIGRNWLQTWAVTHFAVVVARLRPHAKMHPEGWGGQRVHGSFFPGVPFPHNASLDMAPHPHLLAKSASPAVALAPGAQTEI